MNLVNHGEREKEGRDYDRDIRAAGSGSLQTPVFSKEGAAQSPPPHTHTRALLDTGLVSAREAASTRLPPSFSLLIHEGV